MNAPVPFHKGKRLTALPLALRLCHHVRTQGPSSLGMRYPGAIEEAEPSPDTILPVVLDPQSSEP